MRVAPHVPVQESWREVEKFIAESRAGRNELKVGPEHSAPPQALATPPPLLLTDTHGQIPCTVLHSENLPGECSLPWSLSHPGPTASAIITLV